MLRGDANGGRGARFEVFVGGGAEGGGGIEKVEVLGLGGCHCDRRLFIEVLSSDDAKVYRLRGIVDAKQRYYCIPL